MVVIEVKKEDKEKVLEILLSNGRFRALGENKFDLVDHVEAVLKKIKDAGIHVEKLQ